jgi:hypothetical protein
MSAVSGLTVYVYQSFSFGRPPSLIPSFVDCGFPRDLDEYTNKEGGKEMGCESIFHFRIPMPPNPFTFCQSTPGHGSTPDYSTTS